MTSCSSITFSHVSHSLLSSYINTQGIILHFPPLLSLSQTTQIIRCIGSFNIPYTALQEPNRRILRQAHVTHSFLKAVLSENQRKSRLKTFSPSPGPAPAELIPQPCGEVGTSLLACGGVGRVCRGGLLKRILLLHNVMTPACKIPL